MKQTFEQLITEHLEFTSTTFPKGTAIGGLLHAKREIEEIVSDINTGADLHALSTEYADAIFCIIDSANRSGVSLDNIISAGALKLMINKARKWKDNGDGSYSHVKNIEL
jgi:hypothetical protein